ncbi:MAG: hypothetical protein EHM21_08630 [Chloroflexi bacterium]|nr:MAG: hypothetical protein EHM21_08630 [Chloroflexota bacterium]
MANEINTALKSVAEKIARYVEDVSEMTVETRYVDLGQTVNFEDALPAARTEIRLDGDCATVLPVRKNDAGATVVDVDLFDMHQQNVATAIDYRARMMDALLQTFKQAVSR